MKTLRLTFAGLVVASLAPLASAQWLIAGWDFTNSVPSGNYGSKIAATFSDSFGDVIYILNKNPAAAAGMLLSDGTYGSHVFGYSAGPFAGDLRTSSSHNSTLNTTIATIRRLTPGDVLFNKRLGSPGGGTWTVHGFQINPSATVNQIAFKLDTRFAEGPITVSFAGGFSGATSPNPTGTIDWFYQIGANGELQSLGQQTALSGNAFAVYSTSFVGAELTGFQDVAIIARLSTSGAQQPMRLDNIQFVAASGVIPEPSTYAMLLGMLSIGFVAIRRLRNRRG
jgi:hypothetical protein